MVEESRTLPEMNVGPLTEYPVKCVWMWLVCRITEDADGQDEVSFRVDGSTLVPTSSFTTKPGNSYNPGSSADELLWEGVFTHNDGSEIQTFDLELVEFDGATPTSLGKYTVHINVTAQGPQIHSLSFKKTQLTILSNTREMDFEEAEEYKYTAKIRVLDNS